MQYCSLQHWTLLLSPVTSIAGYSFCFGSIPSFFLELFLQWFPVAYYLNTYWVKQIVLPTKSGPHTSCSNSEWNQRLSMKECSTNSWAEITIIWLWTWGFPGSSAGKESTCNAGDCRSGRFNPWVWKIPWRRDRLPNQYSWASLVAQLVKNPPAMWETWVWSLGWKDPLEKWKATQSSILAWRILWTA